MPATRFVFVRHGRTEWNRLGRFRGQADVPLDALGRAQAAAAGRALRGLRPAAIYSGPLSRAMETAEAIRRALRGPEVEMVPGLDELDRGAWTGLTREQARRRYPRVYRDWYGRPARARFPDGESLRQVQRRARAAFDAIVRRCPGDLAIVVSHNVTLRALLCSLLDLPLDRFQSLELAPASISEGAVADGRFRLLRLNDSCHLARLGRSAGPAAD